jgi:sulfite exporter TauE/SafE
MRTGGVLLLAYIVVGVIVAAINNYFQGLGNLTDVLEMLAAILLWPAVLVGVDINFAGGGGNGGGGGGGNGGGGGGGGG